MKIILDNLPTTCEFCGEGTVLVVLADHPSFTNATLRKGDVYAACPNCLLSLVTCSLAPWQFKRARDAGGDVNHFYLHEDFYDWNTGQALQPKLEALTHREERK